MKRQRVTKNCVQSYIQQNDRFLSNPYRCDYSFFFFLLNSVGMVKCWLKGCRGGLRFIGLCCIFSVFDFIYGKRVFILLGNESIGKM